MKKRLTVLGLMLVLMISGCGAQSEDESDAEVSTDTSMVIVTIPTDSEPEAGFDPIYGWGAGEHVNEPLIQSTLTVTSEELEIEYDLTTDYSISDDGLVWTVTIRDDVYFTDGEQLTAEDVAFTYNMCRDTSSVTDLTMLKSAEAQDDYTVVFYLNEPYAIWAYTMSIIGIVPEHAYDESYGENPIGSGRYILTQWDKGQQVILEANPDYYGETPKIQKVVVLFMEEDASLAAAISGQVDAAYTSAPYAEQSIDGYSLFEVETVDNRGFNLPTVPVQETEDGTVIGNDVTSDIAIRRAINIALDREEMIEHVLDGYGTPAYSVCDKLPWYNEASKVEYDPEEAVSILEEAGWELGEDGIREKDGLRAEFTLLYIQGDSVRQALAEAVSLQLAEIGIEITTEGVSWDTAYDRAFSDALVWGWGSYTPMEMYNIYHTGSDSEYAIYSPYSNSTVDAYMDEALAAGSLEESYELWQLAQWDGTTGVTQDGDIPWIWLCNVEHLYFVRDGLNVAAQKIHPHGQGWSILNNVDQWEWKEA